MTLCRGVAAVVVSAGGFALAQSGSGLEVQRRPLSAGDLERIQLPPRAQWRAFAPELAQDSAGLLLGAPEAPDWAFYARSRTGADWFTVSVDAGGIVVAADAEKVVVVDPRRSALEPESGLRWWVVPHGLTVDVGGHLLFETATPEAWEFFWINLAGAPPVPRPLYPADLEDGFMRQEFAKGDRWTVRGGVWGLKQYGGGMPTNEREARDPNYRRASNAFTLVGQNGEAVYGRDNWFNLYAEARFFFGRPDSYTKRDTLVGTRLGGEPIYRDENAIYASNQIQEYPEGDFHVVHGVPGGFRAAFGWNASARRFQLRLQRPGATTWQVLREWNTRPHFSNWVAIGLGTSRGCIALPFLDGEQLGAFALGAVVRGPVALLGGAGRVELDDVRIESYPRAVGVGAPVFEQSTNFAQKELLPSKDRQTGQWTRSELTFQDEQARLRGRDMLMSRCRFPIHGDFTYRASPDVPPGNYCLAVVNEQERPFHVAFFDKTERGWATDSGAAEFELEVGRRNGQLLRRVAGGWERLINRRMSGTVWLVLGTRGQTPIDPSQHHIASTSLMHDLFERAPSGWAWREGNFRMDTRWQCQRGWNFMMGKSRDVAVMFSKDEFFGDQEIEFHVALRFVLPAPRYYVLRDLGFSFCTDGKTPGSGYTLIYGDADNTRTVLLRDGQPFREVTRTIKPKAGDSNIHNYWWHGRIRRVGRTVTVEIDDEIVFEFDDPRPLEGGHVAFWTFRNAFSLAKVSINAQRIEPRPERFRMPAEPPADTPWQPLNPEEVSVRILPSGRWQVTNLVGGGSLAVRFAMPGEGVLLRETPWLTLPLRCERDTAVGLHLEIAGRSYHYPVTSATAGMRHLLTPAFENAPPETIYGGAPFTPQALKDMTVPGRHTSTQVQLDLRALAREMPEARLTSITVGNSSTDGYAMLGATVNRPGAAYSLGRPECR